MNISCKKFFIERYNLKRIIVRFKVKHSLLNFCFITLVVHVSYIFHLTNNSETDCHLLQVIQNHSLNFLNLDFTYTDRLSVKRLARCIFCSYNIRTYLDDTKQHKMCHKVTNGRPPPCRTMSDGIYSALWLLICS